MNIDIFRVEGKLQKHHPIPDLQHASDAAF